MKTLRFSFQKLIAKLFVASLFFTGIAQAIDPFLDAEIEQCQLEFERVQAKANQIKEKLDQLKNKKELQEFIDQEMIEVVNGFQGAQVELFSKLERLQTLIHERLVVGPYLEKEIINQVHELNIKLRAYSVSSDSLFGQEEISSAFLEKIKESSKGLKADVKNVKDKMNVVLEYAERIDEIESKTLNFFSQNNEKIDEIELKKFFGLLIDELIKIDLELVVQIQKGFYRPFDSKRRKTADLVRAKIEALLNINKNTKITDSKNVYDFNLKALALLLYADLHKIETSQILKKYKLGLGVSISSFVSSMTWAFFGSSIKITVSDYYNESSDIAADLLMSGLFGIMNLAANGLFIVIASDEIKFLKERAFQKRVNQFSQNMKEKFKKMSICDFYLQRPM